MNTYPKISILVLAVIVAVTWTCGCKDKTEPGRAPAVPPEALSIFYTCDTQGHIYPCDCSEGTAGGVSRRATYLNGARPEHFILVDAGDVTAGPREWELLEMEHILKAYETMGYHAVNLGHREASMSLENLVRLKSAYTNFVSANLVGNDGRPVCDPYRVVELSNGYRVGLIGIMGQDLPKDAVGRDLEIIAPDEAIGRYLPEVSEQADLVVLLAFANRRTMEDLAQLFFEIPVIIGGRVDQPSAEPLKVNKAIVTYTTDKGKSVGRLDLAFTDPSSPVYTTNTINMLYDKVKDDPVMQSLLEKYQQVLKDRKLQPPGKFKDDQEGLSLIKAKKEDGE